MNPTTEQRNAAFKAASKPEKRVMIAQDVLAQLAAKKFIAERGNWAVLTFAEGADPNPEEEVCDVMEKAECSACALGALMLSEVRINDALPIAKLERSRRKENTYDFIHSENGRFAFGDRLAEYFDKDQLMLIEISFEEGGGVYSVYDFEEDEQDKAWSAEAFGAACDNNEDRLRAIMENIVANNGTFKP